MRSSTLLPLTLLLCAVPLLGQPPETPASPAPPPALTESLERAFKLITEGQFQQAKAELEKATALAGGPCGECLLGMSHVYASEGGKWDQVVATVQRALPLLSSPALQARAYNQLAVAYVKLKDPDSLSKAEEALRQGAERGGAWGAVARYNLAEVLARQRRWSDSADATRRYIQEPGAEGTSLKEAHVLLCQVRSHLPDDSAQAGVEIQEIQRAGGGISRPELLFRVNPQYTEEARKTHTSGTVITEAIIDEEGCVRSVKALHELPNGLTEAAMGAVRQWVFSPAVLAGKPVKVYYVLTVNFRVDDKPVLRPPG